MNVEYSKTSNRFGITINNGATQIQRDYSGHEREAESIERFQAIDNNGSIEMRLTRIFAAGHYITFKLTY